MFFNPNPKPAKHRKRLPAGRLSGVALKRQNKAIIKRDGGLCGVCRRYPPSSDSHQADNRWPIHHIDYPARTDTMDEKISVCELCHLQLHIHFVWSDELYCYIPTGSKTACQAWCRQRVKDIEARRV
jgi:hypothetical protein